MLHLKTKTVKHILFVINKKSSALVTDVQCVRKGVTWIRHIHTLELNEIKTLTQRKTETQSSNKTDVPNI